jgi:hypothetical protein
MAMFQQYQNGVTPVTGMSEAGANIGKMYMQGIGQFGESLSKGLQAYNDNSAKNEILTEEAKTLGSQIQQYAQMFGNSPEHAEFSASLQPYIEQLAKVPSMSLTQKMGAVTGVKAGFANIGQQLQVFELMRGERMKRDMNTAMGGVKEFDEVTVPTAIIPSGKLPYFHDKTYMENESEVTRLATEAKARGANVDIAKVLSDWRNDFKASAMARTDMPPEVKEALVKQIDAGQNLVDNIQTDETTGVTDYAKEAGMYERTATSVKEQLAPKKVEPASATSAKPLTPEALADYSNKKTQLETAIQSLSKNLKTTETISDSEFNKLVAKDPSASRFAKVANLESQGWKKSKDANGNQVWSRPATDKPTADAINFYSSKLEEINSQINPPAKEVDEKTVRAEGVKKKAKEELGRIDSLIKQADDAVANEKDVPMDWMDKAAFAMEGGFIDAINIKGFKETAQMYIAQGRIKELTPENAKMILRELNSESMGSMAILGNLVVPNFARELTREELRNAESEFTDWRSQDRIKRMEKLGDFSQVKKELVKRKELLQGQLSTGRLAPKPADLQAVQQTGATAEATPEPSYTLTNQRNMSLGTTTEKVASSVESKRTDMKNFFTKKYGYIPASFEDSFKAIYPEANFKTMETPYGAFMHDGKEWKQIQIQQPKVMSNKEIAEEKSVTFGQPNANGGLEFSELVPKSGIYVRGIFAGTPTEAFKFRTEMLETANAKVAVSRLIEINDMVGESMPWNASLWGEAKALLPQIKAGLRTDIIGVGTVSNYEQQLIEDVVADPTKFWSLESSDRAKLAEIMRRVNNRMTDKPALYGLEVRKTGQSNAEIEKSLRMGRTGKSKLELDYEARGGKKGTPLEWNLTNKIPDALK